MQWGTKYNAIAAVILLVGGGISFHANEQKGTSKVMVLETSHAAELRSHEHFAADTALDVGHHQYLHSELITAEHDLWISDISFKIENAPTVVVHHAALLKINSPHQTCKNINMEQLVGFARDNMHIPGISFPRGTAMRIKKGEQFYFILMVHNPTPPLGPGGTYHDVFGRMTLTLVPDEETPGLKPIEFLMMHLDEVPCDVKYSDGTESFMFTVPPHILNYSFSASSAADDPARHVFKKPVTVVYMGGHLHGWEGGKELLVNKNGQLFKTFTTAKSWVNPFQYFSEYHPVSINFEAGDLLTLTALYSNPDNQPMREAMGILDMYYYER